MKLIPCETNEIMEKRPYQSNYRILKKFMDCEHTCVKLEGYHHKDVESLRTSMTNSIKRYYNGLITITTRGQDAYLIKTRALD